MTTYITSDCINCGACEPECPNEAISEGDEQRMMLMGLKRFTKYTNLPNVIALRDMIAEKVTAENKYCF